MYNYSRLIIFKNISNIFYLIVDNIRRILFFVISISLFKGDFNLIKEYYEKFNWVVLFGFGLLILGSLIFYEIIILPFAKLDFYTKKAIKKRQNEQLINMNI